jgi:hypothetical protein
MKSTFSKVLTSVGAIALAGGALVATSGSALATPAPYYPDAGATLGGLDFFNAAGVQITSGSTTDSPFVGFAVAQTAPSGGGIKAAYYAYTPVNGSAPGTWGGAQLGGGTNYPITTPTDLAGLTNPIVTGVSGDTSIANYITAHPNTDTSTTDGYAGLYAIRAKVTGQPGYATADILVSGTTWTQVDGTFQLFTDTTTTTLAVTPPSPSVPLTVQTLTATVADTTSGSSNVPAGTVAFFDGTTQIGSTQTLAGGTAHVTTTLALGSHPLTAVFTSSSPSTVAGSTSAVSTYVVANLDASNTALSVNPTTAAAFTPVALTATVTDTTTGTTTPTGSVQFLDGASPIGSPVALVAGVANLNDTAGFTFSAPGPTHSITAQYLGSATIAGSTSAAVTFTATAPACPNGEASNLCTDPQTVEATVAAGTITITTPYSPASPLNLGTFVLNSAGNSLSVSAPFGFTTSGTAGEIFVTDTRAGDPNWTASVQSGDFTSPASPSTPIDGQNAGLIGLTVEPVSGNALTAANVTVTNTPSGTAPIVSGGTQGIGGAKHTFAQTTAGGDGSIGFIGTFTLNAPTSTGAGLYTGTVTFTVG